jgi:predicted nucleotidyltransferase
LTIQADRRSSLGPALCAAIGPIAFAIVLGCYDRNVSSHTVQDAVSTYRSRLERELPGRVRRVALFGSRARGEAHEDSDVDVFVLLSTATGTERARAIDIGAMIGLEQCLVIAPLVLTQEEWDELVRRERGLAREIERDGVDA